MPQAICRQGPPPWPYPRRDLVPAVLSIPVDEKGHVLDPKVVSSSGSKGFDQDASLAVLTWRFTPSTRDGETKSVRIGIDVAPSVMR